MCNFEPGPWTEHRFDPYKMVVGGGRGGSARPPGRLIKVFYRNILFVFQHDFLVRWIECLVKKSSVFVCSLITSAG